MGWIFGFKTRLLSQCEFPLICNQPLVVFWGTATLFTCRFSDKFTIEKSVFDKDLSLKNKIKMF